MSRALLPAAAALIALAGCAPPAPAPANAALPPAPPAGIHDVDGPVPEDVAVEAHAESGSKSTLRFRIPEHLVTLRRGKARAVGFEDASLAVPHRDELGVPFVWESTSVETLETTRGLVHFDADGRPRLRLADPPVALGREADHLHACRSQDDGEGGFTVICGVVGVTTTVLDVTGTSPEDLTASFSTGGGVLARFDFPARPGSVDGRVLHYQSGRTNVVVRVEESWLAGEDRPSLVVLPSERDQPFGGRRHRGLLELNPSFE